MGWLYSLLHDLLSTKSLFAHNILPNISKFHGESRAFTSATVVCYLLAYLTKLGSRPLRASPLKGIGWLTHTPRWYYANYVWKAITRSIEDCDLKWLPLIF